VEEDGIIKQLNAYWEDTPEETWAAWKAGYLLKEPAARIADLKIADQHISQHQQEHTHPTRELASLLSRKRELEDAHWMLRKAGR
jgi:hypothetical protein